MKKYYVGLDVHKATIAIAVLDPLGKLVSQSIIETSTRALRDFFAAWRAELHVTFEEGNHASWLYDVVEPLVKRLIVTTKASNLQKFLATEFTSISRDLAGASMLVDSNLQAVT